MRSWGKMGVQRDFWLKNGVLGEMSVQKDFWVKNGVLGKWACKGTFELKLRFGRNGCAKGLLGKIGVLGEMGMQMNI